MSRPLTVTLGALAVYVVGIGSLVKGSGNPSLTDGTGATGLGLIVVGTLELALVTLALPGRALARACLLVPLVIGSAVVVLDAGQPWWFRILAPVLSILAVVLLLLVPPSRRWFGDDESPVRLS